jgi:flagellar biosynthetic protein FliR
MSFLHQIFLNQFLIFTLVLTRISGLVMTAPIFGSSEVPARVRAFLAVALAVVIAPLESNVAVEYPGNLLNYLVFIGAEALVGVTLGLGVNLVFAGVQVAGQIIGQLSGMQLADVFNPGFDTSVPVISQIMFYVTLAVFVTIGGHRKVLEALLDTYQWLPPGTAGIPKSLTETLTTLLAQSFTLGIRAAAPAMTALLLATLLLGLASRTLPQLNVMALGFGLNSLVTLFTLALSLSAVAWIFQEQVEPMLDLLVGVWKEYG